MYFFGPENGTLHDCAPKLLSQDKETVLFMEGFTVAPEEFPKCVITSVGLSIKWKRQQEQPQFFVAIGVNIFYFLTFLFRFCSYSLSPFPPI